MTTTIQQDCEALLQRGAHYRDRFAAWDAGEGSLAEADRLLEQCEQLRIDTLRQLSLLERLEAQLQG
jgi:hypothetical protein